MVMYNYNMVRRSYSGFTIIETALFIGLSGLLLVAFTVGSTRSISAKRYDDAVDGVANFLKDVYTSVLNPVNETVSIDTSTNGRTSCTIVTGSSSTFDSSTYSYSTMSNGTTKCAIYGKVIFFGSNNRTNDMANTIYAFDIIGDAIDHDNEALYTGINGASVLEQLETVHADYRARIGSLPTCTTAGGEKKYTPTWDAELVTIDGSEQPYQAIVIIVRAPSDGRIHTYVKDANNPNTARYSRIVQPFNGNDYQCNNDSALDFYDDSLTEPELFSDTTNTSFCVKLDDLGVLNDRHAVTILANGQNPSAIKVDKTENARTICS
jgi:hypothetical protein